MAKSLAVSMEAAEEICTTSSIRSMSIGSVIGVVDEMEETSVISAYTVSTVPVEESQDKSIKK